MLNRHFISSWLIAAALALLHDSSQGETKVTHHFAENDGLKIHYVSAGDQISGGPMTKPELIEKQGTCTVTDYLESIFGLSQV